jgi:phosphate uptake regulator
MSLEGMQSLLRQSTGAVKAQTLAASTSADDDVNEVIRLLASALNQLSRAPDDDPTGPMMTRLAGL